MCLGFDVKKYPDTLQDLIGNKRAIYQGNRQKLPIYVCQVTQDSFLMNSFFIPSGVTDPLVLCWSIRTGKNVIRYNVT